MGGAKSSRLGPEQSIKCWNMEDFALNWRTRWYWSIHCSVSCLWAYNYKRTCKYLGWFKIDSGLAAKKYVAGSATGKGEPSHSIMRLCKLSYCCCRCCYVASGKTEARCKNEKFTYDLPRVPQNPAHNGIAWLKCPTLHSTVVHDYAFCGPF